MNELCCEQLEAQFKRDEETRVMIATTVASAARKYGEGAVLTAATGAVEKPNSDVRPLHGVTHGVWLHQSNLVRSPAKTIIRSSLRAYSEPKISCSHHSGNHL